ncbi:hypothetical protein K438DRAFT_1882578 [Mycena galopus ATCC 62051]|nr:hypothetical protein K438DRAFT_1882578 [Mycena galopus ATCC 62051]
MAFPTLLLATPAFTLVHPGGEGHTASACHSELCTLVAGALSFCRVRAQIPTFESVRPPAPLFFCACTTDLPTARVFIGARLAPHPPARSSSRHRHSLLIDLF